MPNAHVAFLQFEGADRRLTVGELSFVAIPRVGESVGVRLDRHMHYGTVNSVEHQPKLTGGSAPEPMVMVLLSWRVKYEALPTD